MKLSYLILGLAVVFLGLLPFLINSGFGDIFLVIPSSGNMYQGLIILVGVVIVVFAYKSDSRRNRRLKELR
ncbi:MAG: hypothetical protein AABW46_02750 [Nanoarchaeota archaeon]